MADFDEISGAQNWNIQEQENQNPKIQIQIQKFVGVVQLFNLKRQKCSKNCKLHRKATVTNKSIFGECFLFDKKIIPVRLKQW